MKVKHVRTDKTMALTAPQFFFAQDRSLAEEAFAGDVVGIPNRGTLRIGDALTEGEDVQFLGIPSFAPEILRRIRLEDAIRAKKLKDALRRWPRKAWCSCSRPIDGTQPIVGVIGALQLDVLGDRLTHEYGLPIGFEPAPCEVMRWIDGGRSGQADTLRRGKPLGHRQRFRRRLRLHGAVGVQPELGGRAQPGHQVHRRESRDAGLARAFSVAVQLVCIVPGVGLRTAMDVELEIRDLKRVSASWKAPTDFSPAAARRAPLGARIPGGHRRALRRLEGRVALEQVSASSAAAHSTPWRACRLGAEFERRDRRANPSAARHRRPAPPRRRRHR